ncbi:MAG: hypothetical protein ACLGHN_11960 [Bacteriovoracia bacterium]
MKTVGLFTFLVLFSLSAMAEETRGKCIGSEKLGLDMRMKNESFCNGLNDKMADCVKNMDKCEWRPEAKSCLATNDENQDHMNKCSRIWVEEECKKDSACKWGYKRRGCNAKDQSKKSDLDHCENFDSSETACNANSQCIWGSL